VEAPRASAGDYSVLQYVDDRPRRCVDWSLHARERACGALKPLIAFRDEQTSAAVASAVDRLAAEQFFGACPSSGAHPLAPLF
jgi:hypothetical protein